MQNRKGIRKPSDSNGKKRQDRRDNKETGSRLWQTAHLLVAVARDAVALGELGHADRFELRPDLEVVDALPQLAVTAVERDGGSADQGPLPGPVAVVHAQAEHGVAREVAELDGKRDPFVPAEEDKKIAGIFFTRRWKTCNDNIDFLQEIDRQQWQILLPSRPQPGNNVIVRFVYTVSSKTLF